MKIRVMGNCVNGDCDCHKFDGANPDKVGLPPFHKDCYCVVEKDYPKGCENCKERNDCRRIRMNYVVGCPKRDLIWRKNE